MPRIRFTIDSHFENVRLVGQAINTICTSVCSTNTSYQVELATVEACNNIVEHAYNNQHGIIEIDVSLEDTLLELRLFDEGTPMTTPSKKPSEFSFNPNNIDDLPEGGMGLFLIDSIMDSSTYRREGNKNLLILTKQLNMRNNEGR
jgi:serine/threonine-protein kinase RsbW